MVAIETLVVVDWVGRVERVEQLASLARFHDWTEATILKRFHYRNPGLWALAVRAYRRRRALAGRDHPGATRLQDVGPARIAPEPTSGLTPVLCRRKRIVPNRGPDPLGAGGRGGSPGRLKGGPVLSSEDVRENPGTLALAASWVLVFVLILLVQWYHPATPCHPCPWWEPLKVSTVTGHRFGDMTWLEVRQGQVPGDS